MFANTHPAYTNFHQDDEDVWQAVERERVRQEQHIELIASENYVSPAIMAAAGSVLTNKYAEGYPAARYYGGCEYVDEVEVIAIERAKKLFGAEYANVQAHSGSQANQAVFYAMLKPGDTIMGLSLAEGGHLTHGGKMNLSGKIFNAISYGLRADNEHIDYDSAYKLAQEHKPKMIITGASAYSQVIDWKKFREIADSVGAYLMADIAHYAGLVCTGLYPSPVGSADFVTSTTHKTLRGPRGGLVLAKAEHGKAINSAIFPNLQGGPLMHIIAAKAICFGEALKPDFTQYQQQVLKNAQTLAISLQEKGLRIVSGGTASHLMLVDLRPKKITGKVAESALGLANITVNKNAIPNDPEKPMVTSGIRLGSPAITTRGFGENEVKTLSGWIVSVLEKPDDVGNIERIKKEVQSLCAKFPVYKPV